MVRKALIPLLLFAASDSPAAQGLGKVDVTKIYGRIQYVEAFADYKVEVVSAFPDLRVEEVDAFADSAGEWKIVEAFPDFTIEKVDAFGDFKVEYVRDFPGRREETMSPYQLVFLP